MFAHYFSSALRRLRKTPFTSGVNVLALALGFACFVAALGVARYWHMSDQHFADANNIYVVTQEFGQGEDRSGHDPMVAQPIATYLQEDFPALEAVARIGNKREWTVQAGTRKATLIGARGDADLVKVFDFNVLAGDLKDALRTSDQVILTQSAKKRLFGEKRAIGQTITLADDFNPTVVAVIASPPNPSHMADFENAYGKFDLLYGWPTELEEREWWYGVRTNTYIKFPLSRSQISPQTLRAQLPSFLKRRIPEDQAALGATRIDILPISDLQVRLIDLQLFGGNAGRLSITGAFYLLGLLVLIVACINYANLATAQATRRAKEVGMRKVLGAGRTQILAQYWIEALLLTTCAAILALVFLWLGGPVLQERTGIDLRLGLFGSMMPFLIITVLVFAVAFGSSVYPVLILSSVRPVQAIRSGKIPLSSKLLGRVLVGAQFTVASTLLIMLMIINAQNSMLKAKGLSPSDSEIVVLMDDDSREIGYESLRTDLDGNPHVGAISTIDYVPWSDHENYLSLTQRADGQGSDTTVFMSRVGYNFFDVFNGSLLAGRTFAPEYRDGGDYVMFEADDPAPSVQVVVDRALINEMGLGTPNQATGKTIYFAEKLRQNFSRNPSMEIIGVVESMPLVFSASGHQANVYIRAEIDFFPVLEFPKERVSEGLKAVTAAVQKRNPDALVNTLFLDDAFASGFRTYSAINTALIGLSFIAFAISLMGLFGMAVFTAAERRHEIGIRKTLGATTTSVVTLLLKDFSKPVIIGNLIAWPAAYLGAQTYLSSFLQKVDLTVWPWILSFVITLLIASLAVGGQAYRAGRVQPSEVLRHE